MDVGLPRETQQIDRVMEAFAAHYMHCNPGIFLSEGPLMIFHFIHFPNMPNYLDHPYILAFSLIMLHTDAFNKSNKRKMTKADYIKNTQFPGSIPEVLDVRDALIYELTNDKASVSTITSSSRRLYLLRILLKRLCPLYCQLTVPSTVAAVEAPASWGRVIR